jgi:glycerol-3-phosphate acyltransferase PlsX
VKIAVDAMGGDDAPRSIIDGVALFVKEHHSGSIVLVGVKDAVDAELKRVGLLHSPRISVVHAPEIITMDETPVKALRSKKNSSLSVMLDLLKEGKVSSALSAGNTGAVVAASTLKLRTLNGIDRPGIATVMPTPYGRNLLMDVGSVTDCKAKNFVQFAVMGSCFARLIMGVETPTVGLLNVGEEDTKGNEITKEAFLDLKKTKLHFHGNVEGRDIFKNTVNVIVTDGFTGNIVLKACESLAKGIFSVIKREIQSSLLAGKIGALLLKKTFANVKKQFNHEEYGGALLLGVNGVVIIAHGSSSPLSIKNAIGLGLKMVEKDVNAQISKQMETLYA